MKDNINKSEFGRGFLICLLKFAEHTERFFQAKREMGKDSAAELWFYGASDHLLELECPESLRNSQIEKLVNRLQRYVAEYRFHLKAIHVTDIMNLVREICLLIDKEVFGLDADLGKW